MKYIIKVAIILVITCNVAYSADMVNPFTKGLSANAIGGGRALVVRARGADAVFWNPARLVSADNIEINTSMSSLDEVDMQSNSIGVSGPSAKDGYGLWYMNSSVGAIPETSVVSTNGGASGIINIDGLFTEKENGVIIGYGHSVSNRLAIGLALKRYQITAQDFNASGAGADIGLIYTAKNLTFGLNLQNLGFKIGADRVPFNAKMGVAYEFKIKNKNNNKKTKTFRKLTIETDYDTKVYDKGVFSAGMSLELIPGIELLAGYSDGVKSIGTCFRLGNIAIDYSLDDQDLGRSDHFNVMYQFQLEDLK